MLCLDIQKGKEMIKTDKFQQHIIGTADFMKRIIKGIKGCGQMS